MSQKAVSRRTKDNKNGRQNTGTKSLLNVNQVIAEANRELGSHPHVPNPQTPKKIYGHDLTEVEWLAIDSKNGQCDSKGRKLRNDTPVLLAGVASYPDDEYKANQDGFNLWLQDNINWLIKLYGDNLKNITLHLDEEHPHIHFFAVSPTGRAKDIHNGYQAENFVKDKSDNKAKRLAYVKAMQAFQDQYYLEVAHKHGMLRTGPKKQRMSRAEHNAGKANAELLARKIEEVDLIEKEAVKNANNKRNLVLKDAKQEIEKMISLARKEEQLIQKEALKWSKNALNMRKLNEAEAAVEKLESELKTTKEELAYFVQATRELESKLTTYTSKRLGGN